jgi:prefoldin subunit 5
LTQEHISDIKKKMEELSQASYTVTQKLYEEVRRHTQAEQQPPPSSKEEKKGPNGEKVIDADFKTD